MTFSVTTPIINSHLAIPFKKKPLDNSKEFKGIWTEKKGYVGHISGAGGADQYRQVKEKRRSEDFPWPRSPLSGSASEGDN